MPRASPAARPRRLEAACRQSHGCRSGEGAVQPPSGAGGRAPALRGLPIDVRIPALEAGESLVAYTDGVTDRGAEPSRSPEQVLRERDPRPGAQELAGAVEALGHEVPGRHPDDMAILVIRFLGHRVRPPLAVASREQNRTPDV